MNKRQQEILEEMIRDQSTINSNYISCKYNVSVRTAQSDIKFIITYFDENNIDYSYSKKEGYKIINPSTIKVQSTSNEQNRIKYILREFLFSTNYIKLDELANSLFVSTTTLTNDLQCVRNTLSKYNLKIESKPYYGSTILGSEKDKRNCIISEKLIAFHDDASFAHHKPYIDSNCLKAISSVVSNALITNKFNITDRDFQNFLMISYLSTIRCLSSNFLEDEYLDNADFSDSFHVSKIIVENIAAYYKFDVHESEIRFLASVLYGKNSLISTEIIPSSIEKHVANIIQLINEKINIDLSYSIELRLSLSLHLIPLFERIESNNLLTDIPINNIHDSFSYSFELAIIASQYIYSVTKVNLTEAEIAYLAIHFNVTLEKDRNKADKKKILFICSSRRSDSLLIKSGIYNRFSNRIDQMDVKNMYELKNININKYDIVFSTVLNEEIIPKNAIKINHFMTEADYNAVEFALSHGSVFKMIEPFFSKDRFVNHFHAVDKTEVLKKLSNLSNNIIDSEKLYDAIVEREKNGYTSYGNSIALPHPSYLLAKKSFCSVAILDEPIIWSEDHKAQIIILCCPSKTATNDFQMLFNFISLLFEDNKQLSKIINNPSYESFMDCLKSLQNSN